MSEPSRRLKAELATAALAADLRAWLEWVEDTGGVELPAEQLGPTPSLHPARPTPPAAAGRPSTTQVRPGARSSPSRGGRSPAAAAASIAARAPRVTRPGTPAPAGDLGTIAAELAGCERCRLSQGRRQVVFGVGSPRADLVLIGEAPGYYEDVTGEPFVGRSGQLLTRMLAAIGLSRDAVYICNVIKCRPPKNRDPRPDEIATCSPFLHRQIQAIAPRVIMTLGRFAGCNITGQDTSMGRLRQRVATYLQVPQIPVVATYHPSYLLRNPIAKRAAWQDLMTVRRLLAEASAALR